ncbi:hypothetical protein CIT37_07775 [Bradyrhizobium ottawaense]|uniref:Uncharacterized protein n=2 Tax=Bradyrhizobium TaxID=374 RepID=A0A939S1W7_9BRAD|nr:MULTISPECIES: hypothetical protein [Bradyrhizobium]AWL92109.1 hypothetical protein CIT37_07775 [Bradyrhizobium ottawaense]UEM13656.1 hypothetical protein J4G43_004870 [Bradyrhizobium barranii subsp. barranii]
MTTTNISRPTRPAGTTIRRRSDIDDKAADRDKLAAFAATIGAAKTSLRRDACGDWRITGLIGHLSTDGREVYAHLACSSARAWTSAKQKLSFLTIQQDGDDEGTLRPDRPLTVDQAETLRTTLRVRKARAMDGAALEALCAARQWRENSRCYQA